MLPQRRPGPQTKRIFALNRKQSRKESVLFISAKDSLDLPGNASQRAEGLGNSVNRDP